MTIEFTSIFFIPNSNSQPFSFSVNMTKFLRASVEWPYPNCDYINQTNNNFLTILSNLLVFSMVNSAKGN